MDKATSTVIASAAGRGSVTRISAARGRNRNEISRARQARRDLRPRKERFAHLKRMYD